MKIILEYLVYHVNKFKFLYFSQKIISHHKLYSVYFKVWKVNIF